MLELKNINNEVEYLYAMKNNITDGWLEIARYITEECYVTSTADDATMIERVAIGLNDEICEIILNEYNDIITSIIYEKNNGVSYENVEAMLINKFSNTAGYKKERFIIQLRRVAKVIFLDAPELILNNEKIMLMDFYILFKYARQ